MPFPSLARMSLVRSASSVIRAARYLKVSTCCSFSLLIRILHLFLHVAITFVLSTLIIKLYWLLTVLRRSTSTCNSCSDVAINTISSAYRSLSLIFFDHQSVIHLDIRLVFLSWPFLIIYWIDKVKEHNLVRTPFFKRNQLEITPATLTLAAFYDKV